MSDKTTPKTETLEPKIATLQHNMETSDHALSAVVKLTAIKGKAKEGQVEEAIRTILDLQPRYIGVYAPGDYGAPVYRLVVPDPQSGRRGRGHLCAREEIITESSDRKPIEELLTRLQALVGTTTGPLALRHIVNPSTTKDEGIRLVWPRAGTKNASKADAPTSAREEMADWSRRNRLIRAGKTVRAVEDELVPAPLYALPAWYLAFDGGPYLLPPVFPWIHPNGPLVAPPPYHAAVSALATLPVDDPISSVSPVDLEKRKPLASSDGSETPELLTTAH